MMKVRVYQKITDSLQDEDCLVIITSMYWTLQGNLKMQGTALIVFV